MVEYNAPLDEVFKALADPTRRAMLARLRQGACSVGELGEPHQMSFAAAAKHVQKLERANLISRQRHGRQQICSLNADPLAEAQRWLDEYATFWNARLDALEAVLNEPSIDTPSSNTSSIKTPSINPKGDPHE